MLTDSRGRAIQRLHGSAIVRRLIVHPQSIGTIAGDGACVDVYRGEAPESGVCRWVTYDPDTGAATIHTLPQPTVARAFEYARKIADTGDPWA